MKQVCPACMYVAMGFPPGCPVSQEGGGMWQEASLSPHAHWPQVVHFPSWGASVPEQGTAGRRQREAGRKLGTYVAFRPCFLHPCLSLEPDWDSRQLGHRSALFMLKLRVFAVWCPRVYVMIALTPWKLSTI